MGSAQTGRWTEKVCLLIITSIKSRSVNNQSSLLCVLCFLACARFEEYLRQWMKKIQELLLESEQLRWAFIKFTGNVIKLLFVQAGDGWRGSPGRAGVLEVPGCAADAAGGADQHAPLQDDARHAQGRAEQAAQGRCQVRWEHRALVTWSTNIHSTL